MNRAFDFCIPTRGTKVPHTPDWHHHVRDADRGAGGGLEFARAMKEAANWGGLRQRFVRFPLPQSASTDEVALPELSNCEK